MFHVWAYLYRQTFLRIWIKDKFTERWCPLGGFQHERSGLAEVCGCAEQEMSICGTLVSLEWSRLAVFKEVTTTVWQLMARFFVFFSSFGRKKTNISKYIWNSKKKKRKKEEECQFFVYSRHTHAYVLSVCMCVCVYWRWGIGLEGPTVWTKIHVHKSIFYKWEHWSIITDQAPLVHKISITM